MAKKDESALVLNELAARRLPTEHSQPTRTACPECGAYDIVRFNIPGQPDEHAVRVNCMSCGTVIVGGG